MEDALDLHGKEYAPSFPTACWDEKPVALRRETRPTQPAPPGQPERRARLDFAEAVRWLVEERYPAAEYARIVLDNLNTHGSAALYAAGRAGAGGVAPPAQTWQSAQHGRDRDQCLRARPPLATGRRGGNLGATGRRLGDRAECGALRHSLAVHRWTER
jgi:hypothetical protein